MPHRTVTLLTGKFVLCCLLAVSILNGTYTSAQEGNWGDVDSDNGHAGPSLAVPGLQNAQRNVPALENSGRSFEAYGPFLAPSAESTPGPCSAGQGFALSDCALEYVSISGALLSWKTSAPSNTAFQVFRPNNDVLVVASNNGITDSRPGRLTREHAILIDKNTAVGGSALQPGQYNVVASGSAPNGHNGRSVQLPLALPQSGNDVPIAQISTDFFTPQRGTITIPVSVTGASYQDVSLWYTVLNPTNTQATSLKLIERKTAGGDQVSFTWDTATVPNGTYTLFVGAQTADKRSNGLDPKNITVNNPIQTTCEMNGPCNLSVTNAATNDISTNPDNSKVYAPGSVLTIIGERLATTWARTNRFPLSQELGGTRVLFVIDNPASSTQPPAVALGYLSFVSPYQINVQLPLDAFTEPQITASVQVVTAQGKSPPVQITIKKNAPGMFTSTGNAYSFNPNRLAFMLHASSGPQSNRLEPVTEQSDRERAHAGEWVMLYLTGGGLPTADYLSFVGEAVPASWPRSKLDQFDLYVGSVKLGGDFTRFAFRTPYTAGIDQINFQVPSLPSGLHDIRVCAAGGSFCSNIAKIPITTTKARHDTVTFDSFARADSDFTEGLLPPPVAFISGGNKEETPATPSPNPTPCVRGEAGCDAAIQALDPTYPLLDTPAYDPVGSNWWEFSEPDALLAPQPIPTDSTRDVDPFSVFLPTQPTIDLISPPPDTPLNQDQWSLPLENTLPSVRDIPVSGYVGLPLESLSSAVPTDEYDWEW